jgi:hypothetical protein
VGWGLGTQGLNLEDLEAIDVKHTNTVLFLGLLHGAVDCLWCRWGQKISGHPDKPMLPDLHSLLFIYIVFFNGTRV